MYYVTYSEYYPIHESAEGGYYYSGKEVIKTETCQTFKKAKQKIKKLIKERSDEASWISEDKLSFGFSGSYIGEGWIYELTKKPIKPQGKHIYC